MMKRLDYEYVKDYINYYDYELLDNNYVNNLTNMKIMDKDGYFYSVKFGNFQNYMEVSNKKFDIVNNFNPYSIHNINNFIKINGYHSFVLDDKYFNGSKYNLTLRCECGNIFQASWNSIRNKGKMLCGECSKKRESINEHKVKMYLKNSNIKFIQEKVAYSDDGSRFVFDFYIDKLRTVIEVNGEQHYKPVRFGGISIEKANEKFNNQLIRDNNKKNYCINKGIKLIILPYWCFDNNNYIKILDNAINKK